jgi:hypothetical protein
MARAVKIGGGKNLGKLLRILQNAIEKSFISWRDLPLVKINTRISDTPCICIMVGLIKYYLLLECTLYAIKDIVYLTYISRGISQIDDNI